MFYRAVGGELYPAINVKYHHRVVASPEMEKRLAILGAKGRQLAEHFFERMKADWWRRAQDYASNILGTSSASVFSDGRSGGWLCVRVDLDFKQDWENFEKQILAMLRNVPTMYNDVVKEYFEKVDSDVEAAKDALAQLDAAIDHAESLFVIPPARLKEILRNLLTAEGQGIKPNVEGWI